MAEMFSGQHDFQSFQRTGSEVSHTVRTIYEAHWREIRPSVFAFTVTGSGFLRQMVRNLTGTQVGLLKTGAFCQGFSRHFKEPKPEKSLSSSGKLRLVFKRGLLS